MILGRRQFLKRVLQERSIPGGGFAMFPAGGFRTDATSWAVISLESLGLPEEHLRASRSQLARVQQDDGRVLAVAGLMDTAWPTALCLLAWMGAKEFSSCAERAVEFLLKSKGETFPKTDDGVVGHDPSLTGWPWILGTFSWTEPTCMSVIALRFRGLGQNPRVQDGVQLLSDRMLDDGGWNYGNKSVYGSDLRPFPATTGLALAALAGAVRRESVEVSLDYLVREIESIQTPLSLGWAILGLSAWGLRPANSDLLIDQVLEGAIVSLESISTEEISVLALAACKSSGLALPALEVAD